MDRVKILYTEDDNSIIEFVKILFKKQKKLDVTFVSNGKEALKLYTTQKFDLVITDMIMPVMNGFDLIKAIRKIDEEQIIVIVTGLDSKEDLIQAIELRVNYFIDKPIKPKKFNEILKQSIKLVKRKRDLELSNSLLFQYKNAIDSSAIVSKSDVNGNITYANDKFCDISKYSYNELIGQNHSIVRHESMSNSLFKNMWDTITAKKQWQGIIKNRAKDGEEYIMNSVIIPILDTNNEIMEYMSIRYDITELEHYKDDLKKKLDIAVKDIVDTQKEVVFTMGAIGETRSKETGNHVKRVAEYSYLLAILHGIDEEEAEVLRLASPMHDIGKVGIPDNILNKPGKLTFNEFEIMKTHSTLGYEMLNGSSREILRTSAIVAYEHHEKWNGTGYPRGLSGKDIHIYGRITAICDVFDALGSDRCYKKAWKLDKILELFKEFKGEHFDPTLVDIFFDNLDKFLEIRDKYVD